MATACSYLFRNLGVTTGLSLTASVANQTVRSTLSAALGSGLSADEIMDGVRRSLDYVDSLGPELRQLIGHCYALSLRAAFGFDILLAVGAAVGAWFIVEKSLER